MPYIMFACMHEYIVIKELAIMNLLGNMVALQLIFNCSCYANGHSIFQASVFIWIGLVFDYWSCEDIGNWSISELNVYGYYMKC